jgi:uncharacterized protein (TIGR02646 family)
MHFVKRPIEPAQLKAVRFRHTPRWIGFYRNGRGQKPNDEYWHDFREPLQDAFFMLCGYCEETCKGEVDHFKPKSRYPHLVYQWNNWIFACHDCNQMKGEKFPRSGYVNPCAPGASNSPESFFDFDTRTGEILPRTGLGRSAAQRARATINDLDLNAFHHLKKRLWWLRCVESYLARKVPSDPGHRDYIQRVTARDAPLSSITRTMLTRVGLLVGIR